MFIREGSLIKLVQHRRVFIKCHFFVLDINNCKLDPCLNGGKCINGVNSYTCSCLAGYSGNECETSE